MEKIEVTFEHQTIEVNKNTTYLEISKESKKRDSVLAVKKNNELFPLTSKATENEIIEFIDVSSMEGAKIYKAAIKFILEVALKTMLKNSDIHFLHSVPGGMLAEIKSENTLTISDISKIKKEMANIIDEDYEFKKYNILKKEAVDFYEASTYYEKAVNVKTCDDIVTIYKLKNYINYFYVPMPYSTKYIKKFELKYLGNNRLVVLYPSNLSEGRLPEYVHHENIINAYYEGKSWLKKLNVPYVSELNTLVSNREIKGFIESCELHFTDEIKKACDKIIRNNEKKFIMIAGPSSSGKTTSTRVLGSYLRSKGYDPICLSTDDYFVDRIDTPKDEFGNFDFECLNAVDTKQFNEDLMRLLKGEEINVPTFNFITGQREYHNHLVKLNENSIILIEGLHSLNDDLTPGIPDRYKYKIYLSPFIPLNIDRHNYISTLDLRLIRRIVRDNRTRGYTVSEVIEKWQSVRNGEEKYIFPFTHQADMIINTALPYELGVLKVYAEPLLLSIDTDSKYYEEARRLLKFLRSFYAITSEYVSKSSILREFIGGNSND
ncbi:phosphoribulokinase / Uridine kinase family protein [Mycoplasma sp. CAG:776]|nr:phosphoribulokinase / Uridine kinase family protein [Mycoplasma sp. CAG:776]